MKLGLVTIILSYFFGSTLLGNISSFENNINYSLFFSNKDTTFNDSISIVSKPVIHEYKLRSPGKAMLYSAVVPGLGQAYMGKWKRGIIYLALESLAAGVWYQNNILAADRKKEYESFAANYWDFAHWIHDYYKWEPATAPNWFSGDESSWDSIREVFVNYSDTLHDCHEDPYCYIDIWDHSHSVKFIYDGNIISSSSDGFPVAFKDLCGNDPEVDPLCSNTIEEVIEKISEHSVDVIEDHHFYEGIQKYDMFFAGWVDNGDVEVTDGNNNNVTSPYKKSYQKIYTDYNYIKKLAGRGGKFMLINRFVSMIDGLFLAKKWNANRIINFNLNVYPDLRNKSGVGGLKLTMGWK